jgi:hypothetical protein
MCFFQKEACQYLIRRSLGRSSSRGTTNWLLMCQDQCSFCVKFCQISTSKMWFRPIKRIFNEKKGLKSTRLWRGKNSKLLDFNDKFHYLAENIKVFWVFSPFISSMKPNLSKASCIWQIFTLVLCKCKKFKCASVNHLHLYEIHTLY